MNVIVKDRIIADRIGEDHGHLDAYEYIKKTVGGAAFVINKLSKKGTLLDSGHLWGHDKWVLVYFQDDQTEWWIPRDLVIELGE